MFDCYITGYFDQLHPRFPTTSLKTYDEALAWWKRADKHGFVIDTTTNTAILGKDSRPTDDTKPR